MICKNCNHRKYNFENFNLLNIPVTSKCKSLEDCIRLFEKPEIIDCDNSWTCENCNAKSNPIRLTKIYYLPKYLIICLKRFDNRLRKISNEIEFELDNFNYKQSEFKCVSICNHFGRILGGGHYTAYCRRDDKWIEFDDEGTEEIENPVTKNAYILIYEKKNKLIIIMNNLYSNNILPGNKRNEKAFNLNILWWFLGIVISIIIIYVVVMSTKYLITTCEHKVNYFKYLFGFKWNAVCHDDVEPEHLKKMINKKNLYQSQDFR